MPERSSSAPASREPVADARPASASWVDLVTRKVASLEFGVVQIVVHDSKVVQVESTERHRFDLRRSEG